MIVGTLGADHTRNYTVIGDTVNIASRIESANRIYGTRILVSDSVMHDVSAEFELCEIDSITVKGRQDPVCIFELLGPAGCLGQDGLLARESYAKGLRAYRAGDWDAARDGFEKSIAFRPDDRAARTMIGRIAELSSNPPEESWDGVWKMTAK